MEILLIIIIKYKKTIYIYITTTYCYALFLFFIILLLTSYYNGYRVVVQERPKASAQFACTFIARPRRCERCLDGRQERLVLGECRWRGQKEGYPTRAASYFSVASWKVSGQYVPPQPCLGNARHQSIPFYPRVQSSSIELPWPVAKNYLYSRLHFVRLHRY